MKQYVRLLGLGITLISSTTGGQQIFLPARTWFLASSTCHVEENDHFNRFFQAPLFIEDTHTWQGENSKIPQHTFSTHPTHLRVVSYNIRFWTDALNNPSKDKIMEVIKTLNPDVMVLQEFDFDSEIYEEYTSQDWTSLFRSLGYPYGGEDTLATIWSPHARQYGTVIFSKFPIIESNTQRFASKPRDAQKQGYTHTVISVAHKKISIYGTHLAAESTTKPSHRAEHIRKGQLKQLVTLIESDEHDAACIIADCNAVRKKDFEYTINGTPAWELVDQNYVEYAGINRPTKALDFLEDRGFQDSFDYGNWPAPKVTTWAGLPVDHIFLSPRWNLPLQGAYVFFSDASDHYPIILDIDVS